MQIISTPVYQMIEFNSIEELEKHVTQLASLLDSAKKGECQQLRYMIGADDVWKPAELKKIINAENPSEEYKLQEQIRYGETDHIPSDDTVKEVLSKIS